MLYQKSSAKRRIWVREVLPGVNLDVDAVRLKSNCLCHRSQVKMHPKTEIRTRTGVLCARIPCFVHFWHCRSTYSPPLLLLHQDVQCTTRDKSRFRRMRPRRAIPDYCHGRLRGAFGREDAPAKPRPKAWNNFGEYLDGLKIQMYTPRHSQRRPRQMLDSS
ncbi:hypothetical protein SCHPADRAFT_409186 [Schizopora paradoxa]|uniref:Uncharacterized protein n=1 Tax=Schizopora paradoxa TaxID=27342 RepID=A0A0H2RT49_9AGAM|nr:hypothetical protein SCHPADRAFT_409186 [Schizopora paradoxa]